MLRQINATSLPPFFPAFVSDKLLRNLLLLKYMAFDSETGSGLRDDISQILRVSDQPLEQLEAIAQALLSHSHGTF